NHITPGLGSHLFPIQWWQHFQKLFLAAHAKRAIVYLVPDTGPRFIHVAAFRGRAAAGPIADTFWAFHGANKGRLLQQTVAAHAAAEKRHFYTPFDHCQQAASCRFTFKWIKGGLPSASRGKTWHSIPPQCIRRIIDLIGCDNIDPDKTWPDYSL